MALWLFAFNKQLWPCDSSKIRPYGLNQKKIAYPDYSQIRPYGLLLLVSLYGLTT